MKLSTILYAGVAATSLFAMSASAADEDKKFDGVYAGVEAGVDWTKLNGDVKTDRSLYYGGVLGFRKQSDSNTVVGLEGTFGDTGYENSATGINASRDWSASVVLGQAFGSDGGNLLYAKAGYVETKFDNDAADTSDKDKGWRFGAGYERALAKGISLRTGVDYTTYGNNVDGWQAKAGLLFSF